MIGGGLRTSASVTEIRGRVLDWPHRARAVVIDVKGDRVGSSTRQGAEALAVAPGPGTLKEFDALMADLKARGIYTIGRM